MKEGKQIVDVHPLEGSAGLVESMENGYAIVKAENDSLAMMAVQRPRDEKRALERALSELRLAPEFAAEAYYTRPVGKDDEGKEVQATDISIGGSMALQRLWGNCASAARVVSQTENQATVQGVFVDYETGSRVSKERVASRFYKSRSGQMVRLNDERWASKINAEGSKAQRNAVCSGLPEYYRRTYLAEAMRSAANPAGAKKEDVVAKLAKAFDGLGIPATVLEIYFQCPLKDLGDDQIAKLRGIYNGLSQGELTLEEAFPDKQEEPLKGKAPTVEQAKAGKLVS